MQITVITCPNCGYSKDVQTAKLPKKSAHVSCPSCKEKFRFTPANTVGTSGSVPKKPSLMGHQERRTSSPKGAAITNPRRSVSVPKSANTGLPIILVLFVIVVGLVGGRLWLDKKARSVPFPFWLTASEQGVAILYGEEFFVAKYDGTIQWSQKLPEGSVPCQILWQGEELWVSDWKYGRILRFNGNRMDTIILKGPAIEGHLNVAVDKLSNRLFIADSQASRIAIYNPDGSFAGEFGQKGHGRGELLFPKDIAFDNDGLLIVGSTRRPGVDAFQTDGTFVKTVSVPKAKPSYNFLTDFAIDQDNLVTIECDELASDCVVASYSRNGNLLNTQPQPPGDTAVGDVAIWKGVVYVSDCLNRRVMAYDAETLESLGPFSTEINLIGEKLNKEYSFYRQLFKLSLVLIVVCLISILWIYKRSKTLTPVPRAGEQQEEMAFEKGSIIGRIEDVAFARGGSTSFWDIVFANEGLYFLRMSRGRWTSTLFGPIIEMLLGEKSSKKKRLAMRDMSISQMLADDNDNFILTKEELRNIEIKRGSALIRPRVIVERNGKKLRFVFRNREDIDQFISLLEITETR